MEFKTTNSTSYVSRTKENVLSSDITLAFALDFNSAGERYTKRVCEEYGKPYIGMFLSMKFTGERINAIVNEINSLISKEEITINVAGNSLGTLQKVDGRATQEAMNEVILSVLRRITTHPNFDKNIKLIRSGGQTGIDEAGIYAGYHLSIPTLILTTSDWKFRTSDGKDISNEEQFKARFNYEEERMSKIQKIKDSIPPPPSKSTFKIEWFSKSDKAEEDEKLYRWVLEKQKPEVNDEKE